MLFVYILTLGASAGVAGMFSSQILRDLGYIPDLKLGLLATLGAAAIYCALQTAWCALVLFLKPCRRHGVLLAESASHAAVVFLLSFAVGIRLPMPHPMLEKVEPFLYLAAFGGVHAFFKLAFFFATLYAEPGARWRSVFWAACAVVFIFAGKTLLANWYEATERARPVAEAALKPCVAGGVWTPARAVPEGYAVEQDLADCEGRGLAVRFANLPDEERPHDAFSRLNVSLFVEGEPRARFSDEVSIKKGWAELEIPGDALRNGARHCTLIWSRNESTSWRSVPGILGLRPPLRPGNKVLVSALRQRQRRDATEDPSIILVTTEGLTADRLSCYGYKRNDTPALDRVSEAGWRFANMYTPTPEPLGAAYSLMTGLGPLRHGFLAPFKGPLPQDARLIAETLADKAYATAAFVESAGKDKARLFLGTGLERGFDTFAPCPQGLELPKETEAEEEAAPSEVGAPPPAGPAQLYIALGRAADWLEEHGEHKYFVWIHLASPGVTDPAGYDAAVSALDKQLGAFFKRIRPVTSRRPQAFFVASLCGAEVATTQAQSRLSLGESLLRVPVLISGPNIARQDRQGLFTLSDLAPTIAGMARANLPKGLDGRNSAEFPGHSEAVSMAGDPVTLSLRVENWRFGWRSGKSPYTLTANGQEAVEGLLEISALRRRNVVRDDAARRPELVSQYRTRLEAYLYGKGMDSSLTAATPAK